MAEIEDLGVLLGPGDLDWVSDAFTFLEYAPDDQQGAEAMPGGGQVPAFPDSRTRPLHGCHPEQGKSKRGRTSAGFPVCQPVAVPQRGPVCHSAVPDCDHAMAPVPMCLPQESLQRPDPVAQRMERKKTREKMRRLEVNDGFNELLEALTEVEPSSEGPSSKAGASDKGNFRVELLGRAVRALRRLHQEVKTERAEVERLRQELQAMGIPSEEANKVPKVEAVQGMPPLLAPFDPSAQANNNNPGKPPVSAVPSPMFVLPWWPHPSGSKADAPNKATAPFPMMMGFPGAAQGMPMAMMPPQFMGYPPFVPPAVNGGEQGTQADADNDVPTHAPCA